MNSQHVPLAADKEAQLGSTGYTAEQLLRVQVNKLKAENKRFRTEQEKFRQMQFSQSGQVDLVRDRLQALEAQKLQLEKELANQQQAFELEKNQLHRQLDQAKTQRFFSQTESFKTTLASNTTLRQDISTSTDPPPLTPLPSSKSLQATRPLVVAQFQQCPEDLVKEIILGLLQSGLNPTYTGMVQDFWNRHTVQQRNLLTVLLRLWVWTTENDRIDLSETLVGSLDKLCNYLLHRDVIVELDGNELDQVYQAVTQRPSFEPVAVRLAITLLHASSNIYISKLDSRLLRKIAALSLKHALFLEFIQCNQESTLHLLIEGADTAEHRESLFTYLRFLMLTVIENNVEPHPDMVHLILQAGHIFLFKQSYDCEYIDAFLQTIIPCVVMMIDRLTKRITFSSWRGIRLGIKSSLQFLIEAKQRCDLAVWAKLLMVPIIRKDRHEIAESPCAILTVCLKTISLYEKDLTDNAEDDGFKCLFHALSTDSHPANDSIRAADRIA